MSTWGKALQAISQERLASVAKLRLPGSRSPLLVPFYPPSVAGRQRVAVRVVRAALNGEKP